MIRARRKSPEVVVDRRTFLAGAVAVPAAAAVTNAITGTAADAAVAGYVTNRAPLQPDAFLRLPPGAVKASGWLATQRSAANPA